MPVTGINHVTFIVQDLERSARLWCEGLGAIQLYESSRKNYSLSEERFFELGGVWIALMKGEPTARSYRHVAFSAPAIEFPQFALRLSTLGVEQLPSRPRVPGEGESLYFYDYDHNLLELHSGNLNERLRTYASGA